MARGNEVTVYNSTDMLSPKWETWPNLYDSIMSLWSGSGQIFFTMSEHECHALNVWASLNAAIEKVKNIWLALTVHTVFIWPNSHFHKVWCLAPSTRQLTSGPISDVEGKTHTMLTQNWTPANLSSPKLYCVNSTVRLLTRLVRTFW